MNYIDFTNVDGHMCNHFYLAFQAYQMSKKNVEQIRYIANDSFYRYGIDKHFSRFNLSQFVVDRTQLTDSDQIFENVNHWCLRYHQCLFVDFNIENIEKFIRDIVLNSEAYKNINLPSDNSIAIHVRNGDYLLESNSQFNLFDKCDYIRKCFSKIDNIDELQVFSDDIEYTKKEYGEIFSNKFNNVIYNENGNTVDDFVSLSLYKNKILWNSTFSYWSAFIGNVIHEDSYENVFAPSKFEVGEPICNHVNPMWRIVNV